MDSSEQRFKRKRISRAYTRLLIFSVRSLILCFIFLTFLYILSSRIPTNSPTFRPVLVISSLSMLSTSSNSGLFHHDYMKSGDFLLLKIENRVLFPDHVLLIVSKPSRNTHEYLVRGASELECIYTNTNSNEIVSSCKQNVLSVDVYDELIMTVRCPVVPLNYSAVVHLHRRGIIKTDFWDIHDLVGSNQSVHSWENVVYGAVLDGKTAVVFVKGLNLKSDRRSDPNQFSCHFGLANLDNEVKFTLRTRAVTAAQEIVRCLLPLDMRKYPSKVPRGLGVTIGVRPHSHAKPQEVVLMPSVAKIMNSNSKGQKKAEGRYELCVCTMVLNQASVLREWIIYHAWLGVERWFIYDNNSDDAIKEVIGQLVQENYNVSRHVWPWIKTQEAGFSHCALRAKDECGWVSFMDVDEFYYFPYPALGKQRSKKLGFTGQDSLKALVANFSLSETIAEIRTNCHSFGPSGLRSPPSQGVIAGYTCRLRSPERHKSIIRADALDETLLNVVHHFHLKKGFRYINLPQSTAVINHYKYQVWEIFKAKFFRRVATYVSDWHEKQNQGSRDRAPGLGTEPIEPPNWPLKFCEVWDTGLRDLILANLADPTTRLLPWERSAI